MYHFKKILLGFGLILTTMYVLTGCNTVKGTAEGASKDIQAASNALNPPPQHKKTQKHTKSTKNSTSTNQSTNDQSTQQNTNETNKSY